MVPRCCVGPPCLCLTAPSAWDARHPVAPTHLSDSSQELLLFEAIPGHLQVELTILSPRVSAFLLTCNNSDACWHDLFSYWVMKPLWAESRMTHTSIPSLWPVPLSPAHDQVNEFAWTSILTSCEGCTFITRFIMFTIKVPLCVSTHLILQQHMNEVLLLLFPFHWGREKLNSMPNFIELRGSRVKTWTQLSLIPNHSIVPPSPSKPSLWGKMKCVQVSTKLGS